MTVIMSMHMKKNMSLMFVSSYQLYIDTKYNISSGTFSIYFPLARCRHAFIFTFFEKTLTLLYESLNTVVAPINQET